MTQMVDTAIVGSGLAGLTAATYLARNGRSVLVLEKAHQIGGRAITQNRDGYQFNLGPHALYANGHGMQVLHELNIPVSGHVPHFGDKAVALYHDQIYLLPQTPGAILRTTLLSSRDKLSLIRILAQIMTTKPAAVAHQTVQAWLAEKTQSPRVQQIILTLCRVSTYANAPEQLSAAVFLHQIQISLKANVLYLDGGWQSLIDKLAQAAAGTNTTIQTGTHVVDLIDNGIHGVSLHLADGQHIQAGHVILAVDPDTAVSLLPQHQNLRHQIETAVPVSAAVLDVALHDLPRPDCLFALGIDQPLYYSVHSAVADLAPRGGVIIHLAKYLPANPKTDADDDKQQLFALLDRLQPGWRSVLVTQRFLPKMTVVNAMATAVNGGLTGRPSVTLPGTTNISLAGDWVGPTGWLVDASFVSAREAAQLALKTPQLEVAYGY